MSTYPPRSDFLLNDPLLVAAQRRVGRSIVKQTVHDVQQLIQHGEFAADIAVAEVLRRLPTSASLMQSVINATGVVLHTNLGRAPLSEPAVTALCEAAGYVGLEFDLTSGNRGVRGASMREAIGAAIPEADDVHLVNNGAAALVLTMNTLAAGHEVIWSRSELVEIGDGFRLRDIVLAAGVRIVEVGATNRTTASDFAEAVTSNTGCILRVHPSNFAMTGYHESPSVADVCDLGVPVVVDIGAGLLKPHPLFPGEPDVASTLTQGAAIVTASCDKFLGGPQAGLIAGKTELVNRMRRHPLARALRVDKLTLAALEATLRAPDVPVWRYIEADARQLRKRCETIAAKIGIEATVVPTVGRVGGGAAPSVELDSWAVSLPSDYLAALRGHTPPIIGRDEGGRCLLDLRCVPQDEDEQVAAAVMSIAATLAG